VSCFHPLKAIRSSAGVKIVPADSSLWNLLLPCGQCSGCRLERSKQWAIRIVHESKMHSHNCFITLTYSEQFLPDDFSLHYDHFQKFMKRLRKFFNKPVRFYMCGEYGDQNFRPHYHACLFGVSFSDMVLWKRSTTGHPLFRSATLERLWHFGHSTIGELNFETAAYTARYIMKKRTGAGSEKFYEATEVSTGEIHQRVPEFTRMSLKPGIGYSWYQKYASTDVLPHDRVVYRSSITKPPRYYDKLHARDSPEDAQLVKDTRLDEAIAHAADNTFSRRAVKEVVHNAKVKFLKRGFS
jgi:hypothetical protein